MIIIIITNYNNTYNYFCWGPEGRGPRRVGPQKGGTSLDGPKANVYIRGPGLQNITKFNEKNENCGGRGKKKAKFWAVQGRAVQGRKKKKKKKKKKGTKEKTVNIVTSNHNHNYIYNVLHNYNHIIVIIFIFWL